MVLRTQATNIRLGGPRAGEQPQDQQVNIPKVGWTTTAVEEIDEEFGGMGDQKEKVQNDEQPSEESVATEVISREPNVLLDQKEDNHNRFIPDYEAFLTIERKPKKCQGR